MDATELKRLAAAEALRSVRSGMTLGLGTGTTSVELVKLLGDAYMRGEYRDLRCACTSKKTEALARERGLPIHELEEIVPLDLAIDGADEIDPAFRLIKGRGGALLREKIVEQQAVQFIVIADETKLVPRLGVGPLPVEVTPFACPVLLRRFAALGLNPILRVRDGATFVTDEGHRILDITLPPDRDIADVVADLRDHAGVVETGFFPREATEIIIAAATGITRKLRV